MPFQGGTPDNQLGTTRTTRRDAIESRCRIIEVAKKLFSECGVECVSMHQIAKSAHVGQGTLYRNYADKADLCLDLILDSANAFLQETEDWIANHKKLHDSSASILHTVIERIVNFTDENAHLLSTIDSSGFAGENIFYRRVHALLCPLLEDVFAATNRRGPTHAVIATDLLLSALSPSVYLFEMQSRGQTKHEFINSVCAVFLPQVDGE